MSLSFAAEARVPPVGLNLALSTPACGRSTKRIYMYKLQMRTRAKLQHQVINDQHCSIVLKLGEMQLVNYMYQIYAATVSLCNRKTRGPGH